MYMRILAYEGVPCGLLGRARGLTSQVLWSERARRGPVGSQVGPARAKPGRPRATPGRPGHGPGHPRHRATQHVKLETRNRIQAEFKTKQIPDLAKQVHKIGRRAKIPKSPPPWNPVQGVSYSSFRASFFIRFRASFFIRFRAFLGLAKYPRIMIFSKMPINQSKIRHF